MLEGEPERDIEAIGGPFNPPFRFPDRLVGVIDVAAALRGDEGKRGATAGDRLLGESTIGEVGVMSDVRDGTRTLDPAASGEPSMRRVSELASVTHIHTNTHTHRHTHMSHCKRWL